MTCCHRRIKEAFILIQTGCAMVSELLLVTVTLLIYTWKATRLLGVKVEVGKLLLKKDLTGLWLPQLG
jgi:hypothetical protein